MWAVCKTDWRLEEWGNMVLGWRKVILKERQRPHMIKQYEQTTSKHGSLKNPMFTLNVKYCTNRTMKPLPTSSVESVVENGNYKLVRAFSVWTRKKFMSESQLGDHLQEGRNLAKFRCGNSRRLWSKSSGAWEGWKISSSC